MQIILNKNDIKTIIKEIIRKVKPIVKEGYFKTYPIEKVKDYMDKKYSDYASINVLENQNNVNVFSIGFFKNSDLEKFINRDMALCGYFPSISNIHGNLKYVQYEPKNQNEINKLVQDEKYIYHLTKTSKVHKIFKNGLTPRTNNKKFKYPGRIYCFLKMPQYDEIQDYLQQFYIEDRKVGIEYNGTYTLLAINTEQIKNCTFSFDPNTPEGIYTYDNISPSAIKIVCEIEQEYLKQ